MNRIEAIIDRIADSSQPAPTPKEILECIEEMPWFAALALAWLRRTADEGMLFDMDTRLKITRLAALSFAGNKNDMFLLNDLFEGYETDEMFYPPEQRTACTDTTETIDRFLSNYSTTNSDKETAILEQLIFNPVVDYASVLEADTKKTRLSQDEATPGSDDDRINQFILKTKKENPLLPETQPTGELPPPIPDGTPVETPPQHFDDSSFSESLAKIYIRQKNYTGAYEIITKLNLKNPEKNIYFAVQLRFLKKLIANEKLRKLRESSASTN